MSTDLAIPTASDLEALTPAELWDIEDAANAISERAAEMLDEYLREWVEVEGKTQTEIGKLVGRSQNTISNRCTRLGITPKSNRGRPRNIDTDNSPPDIEADLDEPAPRTTAREVASTPEPPVGSADSPYTHCPTCGHKLRKDQPLRRTA